MPQLLARFLNDEAGASVIEYALIVALIASWIVYATGTVGVQISIEFTSLKQALADVLRT